MDAKLRADWVAALRSGRYKQTQGQLKIGDAFCCLGVFCQVAGLKISEDGSRILSKDGFTSAYIPLNEHFPETEEHIDRLWKMNDREDKPFPYIADWIEKYVPVDEIG